MSDPVEAIARRLRQCCEAHALLRLERSHSRAWQSLLFDGSRHDIRVALSGSAIDLALAELRTTLAEPDFAIPGHIVADLRLMTVDHAGDDASVSLEALTIEDRCGSSFQADEPLPARTSR